MEIKRDNKQNCCKVWTGKIMFTVTILSVIANGFIGILTLASAIKPSWFYQSGEESMAWSIQLFVAAAITTIIGWISACFSGRNKWFWLSLNCIYIVSWFLAEFIRVQLYKLYSF